MLLCKSIQGWIACAWLTLAGGCALSNAEGETVISPALGDAALIGAGSTPVEAGAGAAAGGADAAAGQDTVIVATTSDGGTRDAGTRDAGTQDAASATDAGAVVADASGPAADGTAGDAGSADAATGSEECADEGTGASATRGSGYGQVFLYAPSGNPFVGLRTKMLVPKPPTKRGVLFLWPGLQPQQGGKNFNPIGLGVLQPVLTWGPSCAPNHLGDSYDSWWISAQYVNTYGNAAGYTGCHGGQSMKVGVGDVLNIEMSLAGTQWTQTVTDEKTGKSVDFTIDMKAQDQSMAIFLIEDTYNSPSEDVIFRSSVLTYAMPAPSACTVGTQGTNDAVVKPRPLKNGLECCLPRIVLRGRGVAASSPN